MLIDRIKDVDLRKRPAYQRPQCQNYGAIESSDRYYRQSFVALLIVSQALGVREETIPVIEFI